MSDADPNKPNRAQRRAARARDRKAPTRADTIAFAADFLANAGPTVSGVTLLTPDGQTLYLAADGHRQPRGRTH